MADKTPEEHFNDFITEWLPTITKIAKKRAGGLPSTSQVNEKDFSEAGIYALHHAIKHYNPKIHTGGFIPYVKKTIDGNIQQTIRNNMPLDPLFYDKFVAPNAKLKSGASEAQDITIKQPKVEDTKPEIPESETPESETTNVPKK